MARPARRYEVFLPLTFNDLRPVPDSLFDAVEQRLLARFEGLTTNKREMPLRGIWKAERRLYYDQVIIIRALDFRRQGSARFMGSLKKRLLAEFDQLEILITESRLRVL